MIGLALILPAADQADGNALACALGHDMPPGATFGVPLSPSGAEPATHFGCHGNVMPVFVDLVHGAQLGTLPELDWTAFGLTEARVHELATALIVSNDDSSADPLAHFDATAATAGLLRIAHDPFA